MASEVGDILQALVDTLRATGKFRLVTLGEAHSATDVPRASVLYKGHESSQPDDTAEVRWIRLRAGVVVHTRSTSVVQAVKRANELCEEVAEALLQDPFRGARCHDLPIGCATEIGHSELIRGVRQPEVEMALGVRCHFQTEEAS